MTLTELSEHLGITIANLTTGKAKAVRFSTPAALCHVPDGQPGHLLSDHAPPWPFRTEAPHRDQG